MSTHAKEIMKYAQWAQLLDDKELRKVTEVKFDNCEWTACNFPEFCDSHKYRVAFTRIEGQFIFEPTKAWLNGKEYFITENMCRIAEQDILTHIKYPYYEEKSSSPHEPGLAYDTYMHVNSFTLKPPVVAPPKDAKVIVWKCKDGFQHKRYSANKLDADGGLLCYQDGKTSWSNDEGETRTWKYWKLAEE